MLNEFYKYIANNTIGFFQSHQSAIRPGERYCLRLDTEEMESVENTASFDKFKKYLHVLPIPHRRHYNLIVFWMVTEIDVFPYIFAWNGRKRVRAGVVLAKDGMYFKMQ